MLMFRWFLFGAGGVFRGMAVKPQMEKSTDGEGSSTSGSSSSASARYNVRTRGAEGEDSVEVHATTCSEDRDSKGRSRKRAKLGEFGKQQASLSLSSVFGAGGEGIGPQLQERLRVHLDGVTEFVVLPVLYNNSSGAAPACTSGEADGNKGERENKWRKEHIQALAREQRQARGKRLREVVAQAENLAEEYRSGTLDRIGQGVDTEDEARRKIARVGSAIATLADDFPPGRDTIDVLKRIWDATLCMAIFRPGIYLGDIGSRPPVQVVLALEKLAVANVDKRNHVSAEVREAAIRQLFLLRVEEATKLPSRPLFGQTLKAELRVLQHLASEFKEALFSAWCNLQDLLALMDEEGRGRGALPLPLRLLHSIADDAGGFYRDGRDDRMRDDRMRAVQELEELTKVTDLQISFLQEKERTAGTTSK
ncbi:unnamed protein product [Amoebophrya sp. A120]|nr:unnamed protein product [Amoebophrya sp. A120]|eukprot:GSA120T00017882001.1